MLFANMISKKHALTLLEVVIAMVLLGGLLTGLFHVFRQSLQKNIAARELKQNVLQLELFQQKIKTLLSYENGVWISTHSQASGPCLFFDFHQDVDPDFEMCGEMQAMLFLNAKKELGLTIWSEKDKSRTEILIDGIDAFTCRLFDAKKKEWKSNSKQKGGEIPVMVEITLHWNKEKMPFVFFLKTAEEKITYTGVL